MEEPELCMRLQTFLQPHPETTGVTILRHNDTGVLGCNLMFEILFFFCLFSWNLSNPPVHQSSASSENHVGYLIAGLENIQSLHTSCPHDDAELLSSKSS